MHVQQQEVEVGALVMKMGWDQMLIGGTFLVHHCLVGSAVEDLVALELVF